METRKILHETEAGLKQSYRVAKYLQKYLFATVLYNCLLQAVYFDY